MAEAIGIEESQMPSQQARLNNGGLLRSRQRFGGPHRRASGCFDSVVTISLEPTSRDETMMTIAHALSPHLMDEHEQGWSKIAERLAPRLTAA